MSHGDHVYVQAGAGLVADSIPRLEYEEMRQQGTRGAARGRDGEDGEVMNVLLIDNYDSFTYNLAQYLGELGASVTVERNDAVTVAGIAERSFGAIVISPGPCTPNEAGISHGR